MSNGSNASEDDISFPGFTQAPPATSGESTLLEGLLATQQQTNQLLQGLIQGQQRFADVLAHQAAIAGNTPAGTANLQANPASSPNVQPPPRLPEPSKPPALKPDVSLEEFDGWCALWNDYANLVHLNRQPLAEQSARLRTFLSMDMRMEVRHGIGVQDTDSLSPAEILEKIRAYFRSKRNIAIDRAAFEERKQQEGESFDSFYVGLKRIAANADLCSHCLDERMATRFMVGSVDPEVRKKLLAMQPFPSLQDVVSLCRSHESGKRNDGFLTQQESTKGIHAISHSQKPSAKGNKKRFGKWSKQSDTCRRCGSSPHPSGQECPERNKTCSYCHKKGHIQKACFQKLADEKRSDEKKSGQRSTDVKEAMVQKVTINIPATSAEPPTHKAPRIFVDVYQPTQKGRHVAQIEATPDSAAEGTVAGRDVMEQLGLNANNLVPVDRARIKAANQTQIACIGSVRFSFKYGGRLMTDTVYFCEDLQGILLPWYMCKNLGILHPKYPLPVEVSQVAKSEPSGPPAPATLQSIHELIGKIPEEPTSSERANIRSKLIKQFSDVFDSSTELKGMKCSPLKIALKANAKPFALKTPRNVPIPWHSKVKAELDKMVEQKVTARVADNEVTEWCHPLVCVPKKDSDEIRVCIDLTKLNPHVIRPYHPFPTPKDAVSRIPNKCKYFTVLDARKGYWQLELDPESQALTTFITPWGRYKCLRAPMGLASTGDEFCHQGDLALFDIGNNQKVVDDMIEYDEEFATHVVRVWNTLLRCREKSITLNDKKFKFAEPEAEFCGYVVSTDGIRADPKKVKAISDFPVPRNLTELRSFFGLVNQMSQFSSQISAAAEPLRPLLSTKTAFLWLPDHTIVFEATKKALAAPAVLSTFEVDRPTRLHTDASRKNGLGYVLQQCHDNEWRIIECGSRFISDTESRYAMTELELLAIVWATRKCRMYLQGLPEYEVLTDHKSLIPILNDYTMADIENPRLQRLKEKLAGYVFKTTWVKGKDHVLPDVLSRAPVERPSDEDVALEYELNAATISAIQVSIQSIQDASATDLQLDKVKKAASGDTAYQQLLIAIADGFPSQGTDPFTAHFGKMRDDLSICDGLVMHGQRIVIPKSLRKEVLASLHSAHPGIEKAKRRARQCVYWPGINSDIVNCIKACEPCQELKPSLPKESMASEPPPQWVFQEVAVDLFTYAGQHFIVYTDRLSGWPAVGQYGRNDPTTGRVIKTCREVFASLGVPAKLCSDNGPQFASKEFKDFLKQWGVVHVTSSPHYPQSNGLAESAVKAMKNLVKKAVPNGELNTDEFYKGLLEYRNSPRESGLSPAEVVLGHPLRSHVPAHHSLYKPEWKGRMNKVDAEFRKSQEKSRKYYNRGAHALNPLRLGQNVRVQDFRTRRWSLLGEIVEVGPNRDYWIKTKAGKLMRRNRRFIRYNTAEDAAEKSLPLQESQRPKVLRRSERLRRNP